MFAGSVPLLLGLAGAPIEIPEPPTAPASTDATQMPAVPSTRSGSEVDGSTRHLAAAPAAPAPPRVPPHARGTTLFVLGGVAASIGVAINIANTIVALRDAKAWVEPEGGSCEGFSCISPVTGYAVVNAASGIAFATGFGLVAGGMARLGRLDAWADVVGGRRATPWRPRPRLGWGLFGGGLGLWAVTRLAAAGCSSERCGIAVLEAGYVGSLAMTGPGLAMIGYAAGHRRQRRALATLRVQPMIAGELVGLTVGGRF